MVVVEQSPEAKVCPFCGSAELRGVGWVCEGRKLGTRIMCQSCGTLGPLAHCDDYFDAVPWWNRRSTRAARGHFTREVQETQ